MHHEEARRRQQAMTEAGAAEMERQSHRWRTDAGPSYWGDPNLASDVLYPSVALDLHRPTKSKPDEFKDRSAKCQVTLGTRVHNLNEPAKFNSTWGRFGVAYPQQFDNDAKLDPGEYEVIWYSDVLEEPRRLQFTVDRMGRVDSAKSIT
jgi:hypothetical protein